MLSAFGAPTSGSNSFETLDFSLPSYGESTGSSSSETSPAPSPAPKFEAAEPAGKSAAEKKAETLQAAKAEKEAKQKVSID